MEFSDQDRVRAALARAEALRRQVPILSSADANYAHDLNAIVSEVEDLLGPSSRTFTYPETSLRSSYDGLQCVSDVVKSKLDQLISRLTLLIKLYITQVTAGDLLNSIKDRELKSRCVDLLSASANFDRAIREATVVLEQRISNKAGNPLGKDGKQLIGTNLVAGAINSEISKAILKLSTNASEHEGLSLICRGLMLSFRNATHHKISEAYSREDALKVCAFIDNILAMIDTAEVASPP